VELARAAPERIRRVLLDQRRNWDALTAILGPAGVEVERVDAGALADAAPGVDARGVLAKADPPPMWPLDALLGAGQGGPTPRIVVALDSVVDPQNLGAIMRSCEFFGVTGLLWTKDRSASLSPAVVRASAGASERLRLCVVTNLATALAECGDAGWWVLGTVADAGDSLHRLVAEDRLPDSLVVVMGSEGRGLRRLTRERCDFLATISRRGEVGSLNVSAAAAVTLAALCSRVD
jgi:23S rRNA (guanosine2251-2'-O)-methyltransferase